MHYRLISESLFNKLMQQQTTPAIHAEPYNPEQSQSVELISTEPALTQSVHHEQVLEMIPKKMRERAKLVQKFIGDKIQIDKETLRLKIPESNELGSSLADILIWLLASPAISKNIQRPIEAKIFLELVSNSPLPQRYYKTHLNYVNNTVNSDGKNKTNKVWLNV